MLSQLFDGIPEILAYPRELRRRVQDRNSRSQFMVQRHRCGGAKIVSQSEKGLFEFASEGRYDKGTKRFLPFFLDNEAFTYVFERLWEEAPPKRGAMWLHIFTAFFTAWLDLQRQSNVTPSYISAFASWTAFSRANVARFFTYYPDGYLVQLIREPITWYTSVKALQMGGRVKKDLAIYRGLDPAIKCYLDQAETMEENSVRVSGPVHRSRLQRSGDGHAWHDGRALQLLGSAAVRNGLQNDFQQ